MTAFNKPGRTLSPVYKQLSPFKLRISTGDLIDFVFINESKKTVTYPMRIGHLKFKAYSIQDPIHIKTIDDFKKIAGGQNIYLDNDIDFKDHIFDEDNPYLFPPTWYGSFFNPQKHVLKNITYNCTTTGTGLHSIFTRNCLRGWVDSLIIDNVQYINKADTKDGSQFAIFANYASDTYFTDCKFTNIFINGNESYVSAFTNVADNCDFYNCEVSGNITNRYESKETNEGLIARTSGFCNKLITTVAAEGYLPTITLYEYRTNKKEEDLNKLIDQINIMPVISTIRNNKARINVKGAGKTGGFFNSVDRVNIHFSNNSFSGKLEGQFTGDIYVDNIFYQVDDVYDYM